MSPAPPPLTSAEIEAALAELPGWSVDGSSLYREFVFKDFRAAFAFMTHVAMWCEKLGHHPDWSNSWNKVTVRLCTHVSDRKITERDIALAQKISAIVD